MPGDEPQPVQVSVGLFFTDQRPSRTGYMLRLGRQDIDIAAGQRDYVNADTYTLPVDVDALAVQPHAHFLAKEVRAWATLPGGAVVPLIYIKDWNFHWQDVYTYAQPLALPKGTVIEMRYTYDNSAANRANPNRPPRRVTFGQTSASEMGSLWLQVVPRRPADLARLEQDFGPKILRDDIAGNEKWLEVEPRNAQLRAELAACYLEANRPADALIQLTEAARLDPTAGRHYDVGRVLLIQQDYAAAESVVPEGARPEARVCRSALWPRRRQAWPAQSGRRNRVVREGAGRRSFERLRVITTSGGRWPSGGRSIARSRVITKPSSLRPKTPTRIKAWRARSSCRISSPKRSIATAARLKSNPIAWVRCWIWRGLSRPRRMWSCECRPKGCVSQSAPCASPTARMRRRSTRWRPRMPAAGQTDRAIATAENALKIALEAGERELAAEIRARLDVRYRARLNGRPAQVGYCAGLSC